MQVNTSKIVRIRPDVFFITNTIKFNLRYFTKPITQIYFNRTRGFSMLHSCYHHLQLGRKNLSTFRRRCLKRRNKLMTNSMIIDIYYPMKLNGIEQEFELPDNIFQTSNIESCYVVVVVVVGSSTHYVACKMCFIAQIWHFGFIMRIRVFTIYLHAP